MVKENAPQEVVKLAQAYNNLWEGRLKGTLGIRITAKEVTNTKAVIKEINFPNIREISVYTIPEKTVSETEERTTSSKIDREAWLKEIMVDLAEKDPKIEDTGLDLIKSICKGDINSKSSIHLCVEKWLLENKTNIKNEKTDTDTNQH